VSSYVLSKLLGVVIHQCMAIPKLVVLRVLWLDPRFRELTCKAKFTPDLVRDLYTTIYEHNVFVDGSFVRFWDGVDNPERLVRNCALSL